MSNLPNQDDYDSFNVDRHAQNILNAQETEDEMASDDKLAKLVKDRINELHKEASGKVETLGDLKKKYDKLVLPEPDDHDPMEKIKEEMGTGTGPENKKKMEEARFEKE